MAIKLPSLKSSKKIHRWASFTSHFSSISSTNVIQTTQETYANSNFESKIQFLKTKLHPDSLNQVLDSTPDVNSSLKLFNWESLQNKFEHNVDTYYKIILKLGMSGNVDLMEGYCNEMVKEKCLGFGEALLRLLSCFAENGRVDAALRVLFCVNSTSFKPDIGVLNEIMGGVVEEKRDFKDVLFVYKEMIKAGIVPNIHTVNYLLKALFQVGRVDTALDHYRRMDKKGCEPNSMTLEILVNGLIASDRVDELFVVLDEMIKAGCRQGLKFFAIVIPLLCRMNKLELAMRLFRVMRSSRISPDSSTYEVMIQSLCNLGNSKGVLIMLSRLVVDGCSLDGEMYGICLRAMVELCHARDCALIFNMMLNEHLLPDSETLSKLLALFSELNQLHMIFSLIDKHVYSCEILDSTTYNMLITGLWNEGYRSTASRLLDDMLEKGWVPEASTHALLMGNNQNEHTKILQSSSRRTVLPDKVSRILMEGLGDVLTYDA